MSIITYKMVDAKKIQFLTVLLTTIAFLSLLSCITHKKFQFADKIGQVKHITVTKDLVESDILMEDQNFDSIIAFVLSHDNHWKKPIGTFPTPQYTLRFLDENMELLFPLWIGQTWIGTRKGKESYLRNISVSERKEFIRYINGK